MIVPSRPSASGLPSDNCPHLGLRDDPQTCLAFPSNWNYCHRAIPPDSVRLEHQRRFCQNKGHENCPVWLWEKPGPLPADLRGKPVSKTRRRRARVGVLVPIVLMGIAATVWFGFTKGLLGGPPQQLPTARPTMASTEAAATLTEVPGPLPTAQPFLPQADIASTSPATLSDFSVTREYSDLLAMTLTPGSTTPGVCGHQLDTPFGPGPQYIIHVVGGGDSLNRYENMFETSLGAIQGINEPFQIPVRKDSVLVIPLKTTNVAELPVFRPYLVSYRNTPIQTMAFKVAAQLDAFKKYNGFDDSCRDFMGWVLSPHERSSH